MYRHVIGSLGDLTGANTRSLASILSIMAGTVVTSILGSAAYALVVTLGGDSVWWLVTYFLVSIVAFLIMAVLISVVLQRLRARKNIRAIEDETFPASRGLVLLVSDGPNKSNEPSLLRHRDGGNGGTLEFCWLVHTRESQSEAEHLARKYGSPTLKMIPHFLADPTKLESAFYCVQSVINSAYANDLKRSDLIVDITGGTKMMSAGATLACSEQNVSIQYINRIDPVTGKFLPPGEPAPIIRVRLSEVLTDGNDSAPIDLAAQANEVRPSHPDV